MIQEKNKFYEDLKTASKLGRGVKIDDYDKIIICGVGGSGIVGDIIRALYLKVPVYTVRQNFPRWANKKTLCIIVSYSGDTAEAISLYNQAKKKGCKIIIITSDGKLKELSEKSRSEKIVLVPQGYLSREALIYLLIPIVNILKVNYSECFYIIKNFDRSIALKLARQLKGKIPVIYASSENLKYVAYRWQCDFNENAKIFAHSHYFPELAHNEIEARLDSKFKVILLIDNETRQVKKASRILKPVKIKLKGKSVIGKIIYGMYLGDLVSYFLTEDLRKDYSETKRIWFLRKK